MPSVNERTRNNVRAGIFVTVTIIAAVAVIVVLSDLWEILSRQTERYVVTFDVESGVTNLAEGSAVHVGGMPMGKVVHVEPIPSDEGAIELIEVHFDIDKKVKLFDGARIFVSSALIGADGWLDIRDVGDPGQDVKHRLEGTPAPGMLQSLLGNDVDTVVSNTVRFSEFLADVPARYDRDIDPAVADVRELLADLRDARWPVWARKVDEVMTWAVGVTDSLDRAVATGTEMLEEGRDLVAENRAPVRGIVGNIDGASADVREAARVVAAETIGKVNGILDRGREGVDEAVAVMTAMRQDYGVWSDEFDETLGNGRLMGQQLKLAAAEIRRSPWKLLYRPGVDELEHELLYEAARSFAVAAADLKAASGSVRRVLETHPDRIDEDVAGRLQRNLLDSMDNYEKAQTRLFEVLMQEDAQ
ncbi:MAG: MlaD family protein [Planctomycetota bacterium]|jgi:ABC-type transporter Mla subunit MlaD